MPTYEPFDWYQTPLYYDIVFDEDSRTEGAFLDAVAATYGRTRGRRLLEPGCGSGRMLAEMARRAWRVAGLDINPAMLRFARRRLRAEGLPARLIEARMQRFRVAGSFDLAHCLVSTFKYLLDERSAVTHLESVSAALKPGGLYVLGVHLTEYDDRSCCRERWVARRNGTEVVCNIQTWPADRRRRTERVRSRLIVRSGGTERRYETNWTFRTYSLRQLRSLLRRVPELEHIATFDFRCDIERPIDFDGEHLDNVLVLSKRP